MWVQRVGEIFAHPPKGGGDRQSQRRRRQYCRAPEPRRKERCHGVRERWARAAFTYRLTVSSPLSTPHVMPMCGREVLQGRQKHGHCPTVFQGFGCLGLVHGSIVEVPQTLDVYRFVRVHEWIRKTDCKGGGP